MKALKSSKAWLHSKLSGYQFRHILFLPMRQGGHGAHPEPAMREAFARASFAGFGTAACDAGWSQSCAVFGLPFDTDTWNSFIQHSLAAKRSVMDFSLFRNFKVTIQIVNSCGESSLLCHLLTLAPRCPVLLPVSAARVVRPPRARVGKFRLTACVIFKVTVTLPSPKWAVTVTR